MIRQEKVYPDICWLQSPFRKVCIVFNPDYVKYILQENHRHYIKSFGYDALKLLLGEGLLTSEGDFWIRQRRLVQPAFHKERMAGLVQVMATCVQQMLDEWKTNYRPGDEVNVSYEMNRLALLVVTRTLFQSNVTEEDIRQINHSLSVVIEGGAERIRNPFRLPDWLPTTKNRSEKEALHTINTIVHRIIHERLQDERRYDDLLDMLIHTRDEDTGEGMDPVQLRDEVMTIFIAGHETTANALAFAWYLLGRHTDADTRLRDEANQCLQDRMPALADMKALVYTRQVIDETLRLYPPAWIIGRKSTREETFGEYTVPAGTTMALPAYVIQHSERYWPQPEKFDPSRFDEQHIQAIQKFSYFPFGGGPRLCIGQMFAIYEMQIILSMVRRQYRLESAPGFILQMQPLITLRMKEPLRMILREA